jgi:hypothetical protein
MIAQRSSSDQGVVEFDLTGMTSRAGDTDKLAFRRNFLSHAHRQTVGVVNGIRIGNQAIARKSFFS